MNNDLEIFIDYSIVLLDDGRIEVQNLCTYDKRNFTDITRAVDYAAQNSNTLSPRLPAGYRSMAVRNIEALGMNLRHALMGMTPTEHIILEGGSAPVYPERLLPETVLRIAGKDYMLSALEASSEAESLSWVERARDVYFQAEIMEKDRAYREGEIKKANQTSTDTYRHISGRVVKNLEHQSVNLETLASDRGYL